MRYNEAVETTNKQKNYVICTGDAVDCVELREQKADSELPLTLEVENIQITSHETELSPWWLLRCTYKERSTLKETNC